MNDRVPLPFGEGGQGEKEGTMATHEVKIEIGKRNRREDRIKPKIKERPIVEHTVNVTITKEKKFEYDKHCVHVCGGHKITWKLIKRNKELPFAIVIKAFVSPLDWGSAVASKGRMTIVGNVREDAKPGFYPYAVCAVDGGELLLDDPEIIVRRPGS